jgi:hypothetical protein
MNNKGKRMKIGRRHSHHSVVQSFWRRKLQKKADTRPTCNLLTRGAIYCGGGVESIF